MTIRHRSIIAVALGLLAPGGVLIACSWSLDGFVSGGPDATEEGGRTTEAAPPDGEAGEQQDAQPNDVNPPPPSCGGRPGVGSSMVRVLDAGFCLDRTEVTFDDFRAFLADSPPIPPECSWKASYRTAPASGKQAIGDVDWCDALAYCRWAGKRLCGGIGGAVLNRDSADTLQGEWYYACVHGGDPVYAWPYGSAANPQICLYGDSPDASQSRPVASDDRCVGPDGVFDLSGNVWEWEDACDRGQGDGPDLQCNLRGGGFLRDSDSWGSCAAVPSGWTRGSHVADTGIRCCSDLR